jgi:hypothetical protein
MGQFLIVLGAIICITALQERVDNLFYKSYFLYSDEKLKKTQKSNDG